MCVLCVELTRVCQADVLKLSHEHIYCDLVEDPNSSKESVKHENESTMKCIISCSQTACSITTPTSWHWEWSKFSAEPCSLLMYQDRSVSNATENKSRECTVFRCSSAALTIKIGFGPRLGDIVIGYWKVTGHHTSNNDFPRWSHLCIHSYSEPCLCWPSIERFDPFWQVLAGGFKHFSDQSNLCLRPPTWKSFWSRFDVISQTGPHRQVCPYLFSGCIFSAFSASYSVLHALQPCSYPWPSLCLCFCPIKPPILPPCVLKHQVSLNVASCLYSVTCSRGRQETVSSR